LAAHAGLPRFHCDWPAIGGAFLLDGPRRLGLVGIRALPAGGFYATTIRRVALIGSWLRYCSVISFTASVRRADPVATIWPHPAAILQKSSSVRFGGHAASKAAFAAFKAVVPSLGDLWQSWYLGAYIGGIAPSLPKRTAPLVKESSD
jgi:hypothetical protein